MQWNISTLLKIYSTERRNPREIFSSTFSKIVVKLLNLPENALPLKLKKNDADNISYRRSNWAYHVILDKLSLSYIWQLQTDTCITIPFI